MTYTEAAAREMKERIQVALQKAMNEEQDPERRRHFLVKLLFANSQYQHVTCLCLTVIRRFII